MNSNSTESSVPDTPHGVTVNVTVTNNPEPVTAAPAVSPLLGYALIGLLVVGFIVGQLVVGGVITFTIP